MMTHSDNLKSEVQQMLSECWVGEDWQVKFHPAGAATPLLENCHILCIHVPAQ